MKNYIFHMAFFTISLLAFIACDGDWHSSYDSATCNALAVKIDSRQALSQADYTEMIAQNEDIIKYIIERSESISDLPDSIRPSAWHELLADPEYLERFSYMFTLGSALYQADSEGLLDSKNAERYSELDRYNADLAAIADRN